LAILRRAGAEGARASRFQGGDLERLTLATPDNGDLAAHAQPRCGIRQAQRQAEFQFQVVVERINHLFNGKYAFTGYVVNGWNNVVDNNTGKTYGVGFGWTPHSKFSLTQNYMAGPETAGSNMNWRQLSDTVVSVSPTDRLSFILNYDYGRGDRVDGLLNPVSWQGWAGFVRYKMSDRNAVAMRYEWFNDPEGFTTGAGQQLKEFTGTFEHRIANRLITRWEYRYDYSNQPSYTKGDAPVGSQSTVAAGLIYTFDMRE